MIKLTELGKVLIMRDSELPYVTRLDTQNIFRMKDDELLVYVKYQMLLTRFTTNKAPQWAVDEFFTDKQKEILKTMLPMRRINPRFNKLAKYLTKNNKRDILEES